MKYCNDAIMPKGFERGMDGQDDMPVQGDCDRRSLSAVGQCDVESVRRIW